ncbi:hypothetical protein DYH09_20600 [bacterium CPR1]|nr:hypothetical protein [bacterium CPR1]
MVPALRRGLSLAETVMGLFILSSVMLVMITLFHSSLRYQGRVELRSRALLAASDKMAEVRGWARNPANFDSTWVPYNGTTSVPTDAPRITVRVDVDPNGRSLLSPCFELESPYGPLARALPRAVVPVRVSATWGPGPTERVVLFSYIAQPVPSPAVRAASVLTIPPIGGPLAAGATSPAAITAVDGNGLNLVNPIYDWEISSLGGNARIQAGGPRHGRDANVENLYEFSQLVPPVNVPGLIRAEAWTRWHGTLLRAASAPVQMQ